MATSKPTTLSGPAAVATYRLARLCLWLSQVFNDAGRKLAGRLLET